MDIVPIFPKVLSEQLNSNLLETNFAIVISLLLMATIFDVRSRHIPNWLVACGTIIGIVYSGLSPYGIGTIGSLGGLAIGLVTFTPFYLLRAMGAGDVKLMAMVGTYLGPTSTFSAVLTVFIAGGLLAVAAAIRNGAMTALMENVRSMMTDFTFKAMSGSAISVKQPHISAGQFPYALAIAAGTVTHIYLLRRGHALLS